MAALVFFFVVWYLLVTAWFYCDMLDLNGEAVSKVGLFATAIFWPITVPIIMTVALVSDWSDL